MCDQFLIYSLLLSQACASVCSPVTPTELDCMNRAVANATASLQSCGGVDFDALKKGDVSCLHVLAGNRIMAVVG